MIHCSRSVLDGSFCVRVSSRVTGSQPPRERPTTPPFVLLNAPGSEWFCKEGTEFLSSSLPPWDGLSSAGCWFTSLLFRVSLTYFSLFSKMSLNAETTNTDYVLSDFSLLHLRGLDIVKQGLAKSFHPPIFNCSSEVPFPRLLLPTHTVDPEAFPGQVRRSSLWSPPSWTCQEHPGASFVHIFNLICCKLIKHNKML